MNDWVVKVDDQCCISMCNVWVIGDFVGELMFVYWVMVQGEMVVELIVGKCCQFVLVVIFVVCFIDLEVVVVGLFLEQVKDVGLDCLVVSFLFVVNGCVMILEVNEGFVCVVVCCDNYLVVGWQVVGKVVLELFMVFVQLLEMGVCLEDIVGIIYVYLIFGEVVQEVVLCVLGYVLYI